MTDSPEEGAFWSARQERMRRLAPARLAANLLLHPGDVPVRVQHVRHLRLQALDLPAQPRAVLRAHALRLRQGRRVPLRLVP